MFFASSLVLSTPALAIDMQAATNSFVTEAELVDISTLSESELPEYFTALSSKLELTEDKEAFVSELFSNNKEQANIVYGIAKQSGLSDDFLIATALSEGVDPAAMLEPTAFGFFFPLPPAPGDDGSTLPPPPPPSTGGGSGSGGVSVSTN